MRHASETPTAVLLVDIQEGFKHPTHWGSSRSTPSFEANVASILRSAREHNSAIASSQSSYTPISIIHVHHHSRSPISALHPSHFLEGSSRPSVSPLQFAAPLNNETVLVKNFNSSFVGTQLESIIRSGGIRQLVVLGLTTDHCVSTTVRMAANLQVLGDDGGPDGNGEGVHGVILVRDAVATYEKGGFDAETVHAVSLASLDGEFAQVVSVEDIMTKVLGDNPTIAGCDISNLIPSPIPNRASSTLEIMPSGKLVPNYAAASVALSIGGLLSGFDSGCIGSVFHMEQFTASMGHISATVTGITVSMILLTGIFPALFAGRLADKHGRLRVIFPGAILFGVGALFQMSSTHLAQFILGRAVSGIGQGIFLPNISVYISEIAPSQRRGRLVSLPQFMATLGICVGYFTGYCSNFIGSSAAWRAPYAIQVAISAMLAFACRSLSESPRWLLLWGRTQEALTALTLLDFDMEEARRDFLNAPQEQPSLSNRESLLLPFRGPYRSRTLLALFFVSMIQLSGIDAIIYYAPTLFKQAGISQSGSNLIASGVSSIAMLAISIPAFILIDRWGRRAARWVVIISVILFGMTYCATWNIVAKVYASEIQPGNTRAAGNAIGMASGFFTNWLVAFITPILLSASAYGAYYLFGGLTVFTSIVLALYMPETRGLSLENIQSEFRRPPLGNWLSSLCIPGRRRTLTFHGHLEEPVELIAIDQEPEPVASSSALAA
ncbi:hypothetical protein CcaCcLH18_06851 [Colletotrichum camelliae]|nr:hypothetical protein CcaCcLH18_06851 [Colletotrichum camelliae]